MKQIFLLGALMMSMASLAVAEEDGVPQVPQGADQTFDPKLIGPDGLPTYLTPNDRARIAQMIAEHKARLAAEVGAVCADLTAKPVPLPSGDMQYPLVVCKKVDYLTVPTLKSAAPMAQAPARGAVLPMETVLRSDGAMAMDGNAAPPNLRMLRVGELDAMQGRPINTQFASDVGYMQGFVKGLAARRGGGQGGFGGNFQ